MKDHTDNPLFISFKRAALYILDCVCFSSLIFVYTRESSKYRTWACLLMPVYLILIPHVLRMEKRKRKEKKNGYIVHNICCQAGAD